jgi:hypothetical protein
MYTTKILTEVNAIKWNKDLTKSEFANFYESTEYLTSEYDAGRFPIFIYIFDEKGEVVGQVGLIIIQRVVIPLSPFFRHFSGIISKISTRGLCLCGPIIHTTDKTARLEILQNIINAVDLIAQKYDLVHIELASSHYDNMIDEDYKLVLKKNDYNIIEFVTFLVDLTKKEDEIWKAVTKKARGDVNRARRRNIIVKELKSYEDLKEFLLLSKKWNESKGDKITDPLQNIEKLWNLHKSGIEKTFLAYQNDKLISALNIGCFNKLAITYLGISSYESDTNLGGTLLAWHALEWAKNAGFRIYDFTGVRKVKSEDIMKLEDDVNLQDSKNDTKPIVSGMANKSEGVDTQRSRVLFYKKKWGGDPYDYYYFIKIRKKYRYKLYRALSAFLLFYSDFTFKRYTRRKRTSNFYLELFFAFLKWATKVDKKNSLLKNIEG